MEFLYLHMFLNNISLEGKDVVLRTDFNVPIKYNLQKGLMNHYKQ